MARSGLYTIFLDSTFGHPYQNVYVPVLVQHLASVAVPPAVKQNAFTGMSGDVRGPTVQDGVGNGSAMINTIAASAPAASPAPTATCNQIKDID